MATALIALAPVFALVLLGFLMKVSPFPTSSVSPAAEKLTYYVLFPALLLHSLAAASLGGLAVLPAAAAMTTGVVIVVRPPTGSDGAERYPFAEYDDAAGPQTHWRPSTLLVSSISVVAAGSSSRKDSVWRPPGTR